MYQKPQKFTETINNRHQFQHPKHRQHTTRFVVVRDRSQKSTLRPNQTEYLHESRSLSAPGHSTTRPNNIQRALKMFTALAWAGSTLIYIHSARSGGTNAHWAHFVAKLVGWLVRKTNLNLHCYFQCREMAQFLMTL